MDPDAKELVILFANGLIVLAVSVGVIHDLMSCKFLLQVRSALEAVRESLRPSHAEAEDEVSRIVQEKMQKQKLDHFRTACRIFCVGFAAFTANGLIQYLKQGGLRFYTFPQAVVHLSGHAVLAIVYLRPSIIVWGNIDVFYFVFVACVTLWISPIFCSRELMMIACMVGNLCIIVLTFLRRSLLVVASANLAFSISASALIWTARGHGPSATPVFAICIQCSGVLFVTGMAHLLEIHVRAMFQQSVDVQATREMLDASSALLRSCCDVLVELDADGRIASVSKDLGSFLLRGSDHCLQGWLLSDLISHEEDRSKFLETLGSRRPVGQADAMHVRMKDGNAKLLQIELLLLQFCHLGSQPKYLVGLREFADQCACCGSGARRGAELAPEGLERAAAPADEDNFSLSEAAPVTSSSVEVPFVEAILDATTPGLNMKEHSTGFALRIGHVATNAHFADLLKDVRGFTSWLQATYNEYVYEDLPEAQMPVLRITLNMPQRSVKAFCVIVPQRIAQEGDEESKDSEESETTIDMKNLRLRFFKIAQCVSHCKAASDFKGTPVSIMSL